MNENRVRSLWPLLVFVIGCAAVLLIQLRAASEDENIPVHMSTDWSTQHLIYSGEPTGPNARIATQDPRYLRHLHIYGAYRKVAEQGDVFDVWKWFRGPGPVHRHEALPIKRDWQFNLGANAVTSNPLGAIAFPAKFSFNINATPSCANDFVVFPTGLPGASGGQASMVALNQLYSGTVGGIGICGAAGPSVMWAYNTNSSGDTAGLIYTSPVLSIDGSKVAFIETGNGTAILKILKWVSSQGTVSDAVTPTPISSWTSCPTSGTSCLVSVTFSGSTADSNSSPFYSYSNDTLYVGDDDGVLHKFTGVFNGTPAEVKTGGWPFTIATGNFLTGPAFDAISGNIFVSDWNFASNVSNSLHYIRETGSTAGACASGTTLPCIGTPSLEVSDTADFGVLDPPTVDQTTQKVFVYTGINLSGNGAVIQTTTALGSPVDTAVQAGSFEMFSGAFDKNYHSGSYASGFLYVCGTQPTTLYRIGFNSLGVMNSTKATGSVDLELSDDEGSSCSPATSILNGTNDYLFFGIFEDGAATGCSNGCLMGLNLTTMTWPPNLSTFSTLPVPGGVSGIVVDNVGAGGQESNVYFGPEGNNCTTPAGSGCAVKATQSGLN